MERNRKDKDSKFRLILIESRIHRLSRYYKRTSVLPPAWRYEAATARSAARIRLSFFLTLLQCPHLLRSFDFRWMAFEKTKRYAKLS